MRGKFALVLLLLHFLLGTTVQAAPALRIAYPEFAPFHYTDANGELTGFFYEIVTEAVQNRMGIPTVWTPYPWTRCQENVKNGRDDAILTVPTPERGIYTITHRKPIYEKTLHLFTHKDHPQAGKLFQIKTLADIKKNRLSIITYSGNGWHKKHVASLGIKTYETSGIENVWHMLALKRGDIVIEWPSAAYPDIRQAGREAQVIDTNIVIASMPFYLLIRSSSNYVNILDTFDATIESMKRDGTMSSILDAIH